MTDVPKKGPIKIDEGNQAEWIAFIQAELPVNDDTRRDLLAHVHAGELTVADRETITAALAKITVFTTPARRLLKAASFFIPNGAPPPPAVPDPIDDEPSAPERELPLGERSLAIVTRILRYVFAATGVGREMPPAKVRRATETQIQRFEDLVGRTKGNKSKWTPLQFLLVAIEDEGEGRDVPAVLSGVPTELIDAARVIVTDERFSRQETPGDTLPLLAAYSGKLSQVTHLPEEHPSTIAGNERMIPSGAMMRLVDRERVEIGSGIVRYTKLGDTYEHKAPGMPLERTLEGIHTWADLEQFIDMALDEKLKKGQSLEVVVDQYNFPTMQPSKEVLQGITLKALTSKCSVVLVVKGDPMDRPRIYQFDRNGLHISLLERNEEAINFWKGKSIDGAVREYLGRNPEQKILSEALYEAHVELPESNLGDLLSRVIELYNEKTKAASTVKLIPPDQRTMIFSMVDRLRDGLRSTAISQINISEPKKEVPPSALYWDPVDTILRDHPANRAPDNCWFSIGAGQMIATLEFARTMMDHGHLPLDFKLMASDASPAQVWEINTHGRNQGLGDTMVNPENRKRIYVVNSSQTDEALLTLEPRVVLLNVKAKLLWEALITHLPALKVFKPVMATPAKAYDGRGRIIYLDIYNKLRKLHENYPSEFTEESAKKFADSFLVMGGFFEAPRIMRGVKVDMTIAGGSEEALITLARGLSPVHVNTRNNRADWERLAVKLIPSVELAAALQAGGANKNFLTYRSSSLVMREVLKLTDETPTGGQIDSLRQMLADERIKNIQIGEEITARIIPVYASKVPGGIATDHLWSSQGLEEDFRNCLPGAIDWLFPVRNELIPILERRDEDAFHELIRKIMRGEFPMLGTRNSVDGIIDEVIYYAYGVLHPGDANKLDDMSSHSDVMRRYNDFYRKHYPPEWTGDNAQEGRNGIAPLIVFANRHRVTLPREVFQAWGLYNPDTPRSPPPERENEGYTPPKDDEIREPWGLPKKWVEELGKKTFLAVTVLGAPTVTGEAPNPRNLSTGLNTIKEALDKLGKNHGRYPEVTRRLLVIRERINSLIRLFEEEAGEIPSGQYQNAEDEFWAATDHILQIFKKRLDNTTDILTHLRYAAIHFFRVELTIRQDLRAKLGLGFGPARRPSTGTVRVGELWSGLSTPAPGVTPPATPPKKPRKPHFLPNMDDPNDGNPFAVRLRLGGDGEEEIRRWLDWNGNPATLPSSRGVVGVKPRWGNAPLRGRATGVGGNSPMVAGRQSTVQNSPSLRAERPPKYVAGPPLAESNPDVATGSPSATTALADRRPSTLLGARDDRQGVNGLDFAHAQWLAKIGDAALRELVKQAFLRGETVEDFQRRGMEVLGRSTTIQKLYARVPGESREEFLIFVGMQMATTRSIDVDALEKQLARAEIPLMPVGVYGTAGTSAARPVVGTPGR